MRTCPKCKSPTLAPLDDSRDSDPNVLPPSRCASCRGVWMPHEAIAHHLVPAFVDADQAPPGYDAMPGACPLCQCILGRARVESGAQSFHLERCGICAGTWFDAGEWAAVAASEWLDHLDDLWDPVWRKKVRERRADERHLEELKRALGPETLAAVNKAIEALRRHPMRSLGLSFLIEELRGPA